MKSRVLAIWCFTAAGVVWAASGVRAQDPELAQQGYDLLKKYCHRCHGVVFDVPGLNMLDRDILVQNRGQDPAYIVPDRPGESHAWQRIENREMPPDDAPQPSDEERAVLKKWIEDGAAFPLREENRAFLGTGEILSAVSNHLNQTPREDRKFQRYFTLTNLHNNPRVTDDELRLYRAALSKLVNSLSWERRIVVPAALDPDQTVFVVDLRELGWDTNQGWQEIVKAYPYGLRHDHTPANLVEIAKDVYERCGSAVPYVRADWFIATAARPPLYHKLLDLPDNAPELEKLLRVNVQADFAGDQLDRAAFPTSGVSAQNRLVDRHDAVHGAYWKSYDFKTNQGRGNLFQFPLGPEFPQNAFNDRAFQHDGGEIIFNLPNGLQGYLLVDGQDKRIDVGPIVVVSDTLKTSGTPEIVNGLSCMACHRHGVIRFKDALRNGAAVFGELQKKVQNLCPPQPEMDKLLDRDESQFLAALDAASGGFLRAGGDQRDIKQFEEPIGAIARLYEKDLGLAEVACELGIADPKHLSIMIQSNPRLRELGLAPLMNGAAIKRSNWQSLDQFLSQFQQVSLELDLGTPHRVLGSR